VSSSREAGEREWGEEQERRKAGQGAAGQLSRPARGARRWWARRPVSQSPHHHHIAVVHALFLRCDFEQASASMSAPAAAEAESAAPMAVSSLALPKDVLLDVGFELIRLLKSVDSCGYNLYDGPALQRAMWRYETMWLPLLGALSASRPAAPSTGTGGGDVNADVRRQMNDIAVRLAARSDLQTLPVVPPLDVAWVWYIHRLSVDVYLRDVTAVAGAPVAPDATSAFRFGASNRSRKARLWQAAYPAHQSVGGADRPEAACREYFPLYLRSLVNTRGKVVARQAQLGSVTPVNYTSQFTYDIARAVNIHRGALWLYMRNRDLSKEYLPRAVSRYEWYMLLRGLHPEKALEAADDIDLVWRVHAASTADYLSDDLVFCALAPNSATPRAAKSGEAAARFAHTDARIVLGGQAPSASESQRLLRETADVWRATLGDKAGPYLVPSHVPRLAPRGKRDGYLQEVLRRKLVDGGSSTSSSSSESSAQEDDERECGLHSSSTGANGAVPSSGPSVSREVSPTRDDAGSPFSPTASADPSALSSPARSSSAPPAPSSSRSRLAVISSRPKRLRFAAKHDSILPGEGADASPKSREDDGDEESQRQASIVRKRERREMRKRRAEERQIQRDLATHQSHNFGGGKKETFTKLQIARSTLIGLLGLTLVLTGGIIMGQKAASVGALGLGLFFAGLLCFILATVALKRPDAAERALARKAAKELKAQRESLVFERKTAKAEKCAFMNAIQEYTFTANECRIVIGGGDALDIFAIS
jgi:hypothetical protein